MNTFLKTFLLIAANCCLVEISAMERCVTRPVLVAGGKSMLIDDTTYHRLLAIMDSDVRNSLQAAEKKELREISAVGLGEIIKHLDHIIKRDLSALDNAFRTYAITQNHEACCEFLFAAHQLGIALVLEEAHKFLKNNLWIVDYEDFLVQLLLFQKSRLPILISGMPMSVWRKLLTESAAKGKTSIVSTLLTFSVNCNVGFADVGAPLTVAAAKGQLEVLNILIQKGALVNGMHRGTSSPLIEACKGGHMRCVESLLRHGASKDLGDKEGMTALEYAIMNGSDELIVLLAEDKEAAEDIELFKRKLRARVLSRKRQLAGSASEEQDQDVIVQLAEGQETKISRHDVDELRALSKTARPIFTHDTMKILLPEMPLQGFNALLRYKNVLKVGERGLDAILDYFYNESLMHSGENAYEYIVFLQAAEQLGMESVLETSRMYLGKNISRLILQSIGYQGSSRLQSEQELNELRLVNALLRLPFDICCLSDVKAVDIAAFCDLFLAIAEKTTMPENAKIYREIVELLILRATIHLDPHHDSWCRVLCRAEQAELSNIVAFLTARNVKYSKVVLADGEPDDTSTIVSEVNFEEMSSLSSFADIMRPDRQGTVTLPGISKKAFHLLMMHKKVIKQGGQPLVDLLEHLFQAYRTLPFEENSSDYYVLLSAADYLGIDSVLDASSAFLRKKIAHIITASVSVHGKLSVLPNDLFIMLELLRLPFIAFDFRGVETVAAAQFCQVCLQCIEDVCKEAENTATAKVGWLNSPQEYEELLELCIEKAGAHAAPIGSAGQWGIAPRQWNHVLFKAIIQGCARLVDLLMARGVTCDHFAFRTACRNGHSDVVQLLVDQKKFDINEQGDLKRTALMAACERDHEGIVDLLVKRGARVDLVDNEGRTALHLAHLFGANRCAAVLQKELKWPIFLTWSDGDSISITADDYAKLLTIGLLRYERCQVNPNETVTVLIGDSDLQEKHISKRMLTNILLNINAIVEKDSDALHASFLRFVRNNDPDSFCELLELEASLPGFNILPAAKSFFTKYYRMLIDQEDPRFLLGVLAWQDKSWIQCFPLNYQEDGGTLLGYAVSRNKQRLVKALQVHYFRGECAIRDLEDISELQQRDLEAQQHVFARYLSTRNEKALHELLVTAKARGLASVLAAAELFFRRNYRKVMKERYIFSKFLDLHSNEVINLGSLSAPQEDGGTLMQCGLQNDDAIIEKLRVCGVRPEGVPDLETLSQMDSEALDKLFESFLSANNYPAFCEVITLAHENRSQNILSSACVFFWKEYKAIVSKTIFFQKFIEFHKNHILDLGNLDQIREDGDTLLGYAASECCSSIIVDLILQAGGHPDIADIHGATPLMKAAKRARNDAFNLLLNAGASKDRKDNAGLGLIDYAVMRGPEAATMDMMGPFVMSKKNQYSNRQLEIVKLLTGLPTDEEATKFIDSTQESPNMWIVKKYGPWVALSLVGGLGLYVLYKYQDNQSNGN